MIESCLSLCCSLEHQTDSLLLVCFDCVGPDERLKLDQTVKEKLEAILVRSEELPLIAVGLLALSLFWHDRRHDSSHCHFDGIGGIA